MCVRKRNLSSSVITFKGLAASAVDCWVGGGMQKKRDCEWHFKRNRNTVCDRYLYLALDYHECVRTFSPFPKPTH